MLVGLPSIESHCAAIEAKIKKPFDPTLQLLSNEEFWKEFNNLEIYSYWKSIEQFAHLDTAELLNLLEDHVLPLQRSYEFWLLEHPEEESQQVDKIIWQLSDLKAQIFKALLIRCQVHKKLKTSRQCDDALEYVVRAINQTDFFKEKPLQEKTMLSDALNDDRRLAIYDYIRQVQDVADAQFENIIGPILKRPRSAQHSPDLIQEQINRARIFRESFIPQWRITSLAQKWMAALSSEISFWFIPLKSKMGFWFIVLEKSRYLVYLALSLLLYYFVLQLVSPIILFSLGVNALVYASNVLFYTLGMAPLWIAGWQFGSKLWSKLYNFMTHQKKQQLFDALVLSEKSTHFIYEKLHTTIVDISHFDIQELQETASSLIAQLRYTQTLLNQYSSSESFFCGFRLKANIKSVSENIEKNQKKLKKSLSSLAEQMATAMGAELDLLENTTDGKNLIPTLSLAKIQQYAQFIKAFATPQAYSLFLKNTNPMHRWVQKVIDSYFVFPQEVATGFEIPWGKHKRREDLLNGWNKILASFNLVPALVEGCLELNAVLQGEKIITTDRFKAIIKQLNLGEQQQAFMNAFQNTLFATLDSKSAPNAHLLSTQQRNIIATWREQYEQQIQAANLQCDTIMNSNATTSVADEDLIDMFRLLEAEDVCSYASNKSANLTVRQNRIRAAIENYTGDSDVVFRFVRFIPTNERPEVISKIAALRLGHLLSKKAGSWTDADKELFHHPDLTSFADLLKDATKPPTPQFISHCRINLLDCGDIKVPTNPRRRVVCTQ